MPPTVERRAPGPFPYTRAGGSSTEEDEEEEEMPRKGRPCYVFNPVLRRNLDDTACEHCRFYLTARCPHLDEFMEDLDDLSPEG